MQFLLQNDILIENGGGVEKNHVSPKLYLVDLFKNDRGKVGKARRI